MIVQKEETTMDPIKLGGIIKWPIPTTIKETCSFLGFTNFYQQFISNYSTVARPLINLTKKNSQWTWKEFQQKTFEHLKTLFLSKPVHQFPDFSKPFAIAINASLHATKGILLQTNTNGDWHSCFYLSQLFSPAKQNYDVYNQELLVAL